MKLYDFVKSKFAAFPKRGLIIENEE